MLVYYFAPFIVSNRYLLFWVWNGHNSVTVQNRTHVCMNFFDHKDLGNHLLQLCPKVVKHPVCMHSLSSTRMRVFTDSFFTAWFSHCSRLLGTQTLLTCRQHCRCCVAQSWILPEIRSPTDTFLIIYSLLKTSAYTVGVCFDTLWVVDTPEYSSTGYMYRPGDRLSRPRLLQRKLRTFGSSFHHVPRVPGRPDDEIVYGDT